MQPAAATARTISDCRFPAQNRMHITTGTGQWRVNRLGWRDSLTPTLYPRSIHISRQTGDNKRFRHVSASPVERAIFHQYDLASCLFEQGHRTLAFRAPDSAKLKLQPSSIGNERQLPTISRVRLTNIETPVTIGRFPTVVNRRFRH